MNYNFNFSKEELLDFLKHEASVPFSGWDFSYVRGRMVESPLEWGYGSFIKWVIPHIDSILDMGTGGGEFLSTLQPFPKHTCATEGYDLNYPIAKGRLEPLGVKVIKHESDDNLPFKDEEFELIINRHESYSTEEVFRILKKNGFFITQQVGGDNDKKLRELLTGKSKGEYDLWNVNSTSRDLQIAGYKIIEKKECYPTTRFFDVGAIVFYLAKIPWAIPGFSVEKYFNQLYEINNIIQEIGYLDVSNHRFFLKAYKP